MILKFRRQWRMYRPGIEAEMADGVANILIMKGVAEQVHQAVAPAVPRKFEPSAKKSKR